jgi:polar amino acid transport system permease protein
MNFQFQFGAVFAEQDLLLNGVLLTLGLSIGAILMGTTLALLLVCIRFLGTAPLRLAADAYVELLRNTPFLVQLFIIFFGLPLLGFRMSGAQAALLTMVLNLSAYSTEIIRAGVDATHKSQIEAGVSLALSRLQVFTHVILVPALAKVWPALSSQYVLMLLASSIVSFISVEELSGAAAIIEQRTFRSFETYIVATLIYLVLALALKAVLFWIGRLAFPRMSGLARQQAGN